MIAMLISRSYCCRDDEKLNEKGQGVRERGKRGVEWSGLENGEKDGLMVKSSKMDSHGGV